MASAKQRAHQEKVRAFYARNGRFPRKGELGRSRVSSGSATPPGAPRKRRRRAKKPTGIARLVKWVKKNPGKSVAAVVGIGGVGYAASRPEVRMAASNGLAAIRGR